MKRVTTLSVLSVAVVLFAIVQPAFGEPLFTETFDVEVSEIGRGTQFESRLPLKHAAEYPGWTKQGDMPVHFVLRSPADWALMLFSHQPNENVLTLDRPFAANEKGHVYTVSLDVGPAVYGLPVQTTQKGDQILVELVRPDGSVLERLTLDMRAWDGSGYFTNKLLTYQGDGSGELKFRISPGGSAGRFYGAIDNLQVFASADEAKAEAAKRAALEKERYAQLPLPPRDKVDLRRRLAEACLAIPDGAVRVQETVLPANEETVLDAVEGNAIVLEIEIDPQESRWVQLSVLRSPGAEEETAIRFYNFDRRISIWYATQSQLVLDTTHSSLSPEAPTHSPQKALFSRRAIKMPGEGVVPAGPLKLQVFIDRTVVGVLADDKPFLAARVGPARTDSVGVAFRACGQDAILKSLKAWKLDSAE